MRPFVALCLVSLAAAAVPSSAVADPPVITSSIDGIAGNNGWWKGNSVVLHWVVTPPPTDSSGCDPGITIPGPTTGVTKTCTATNGPDMASASRTTKIDGDPPTGVSVTPARAPDANGWYNHLVGLTWSGNDATSGISSCTSSSYSGPDGAAASSVRGNCQDKAGNNSAPLPFDLQYDSTPPQVNPGSPGRGPDGNGWYSHPVTITWSDTDATSGMAGCTLVTYSGPDDATGSAAGATCHDKAGNVASAPAFALKYDATPPQLTPATASRPPDSNGWYTHPVTITWHGTDALSGIGPCTSAPYSGPDSATASDVGSCRDKAGNVASASFALKYDATPPALSKIGVTSRAASDLVRWTSSSASDTAVVKRWARGSSDQQVVFQGADSRFVDKKIQVGIEYVYAIQTYDQAGNASKKITVDGLPKVLTLHSMPYIPRAAPNPILRWQRNRVASYYHVQLFRGSKRIFAAWPSTRQLSLPASWKWAGHRYRLGPGRYRWYVWGGLGRRSFARYKSIGSARFIVPPS